MQAALSSELRFFKRNRSLRIRLQPLTIILYLFIPCSFICFWIIEFDTLSFFFIGTLHYIFTYWYYYVLKIIVKYKNYYE